MAAPFLPLRGHSYLDGPPRQVPGYGSLHRMVEMLLAETAPVDARILVLGAGGGLELRALAEAQPEWRFDGVDPSIDMLELARTTVGPNVDRINLQQGRIFDAPDGPFDGATCLLVFHFVPIEERMATLRELRRRLKPGAPLVLMHISFSQEEPERSEWIARHAAYGAPPGTDRASLAGAREAIGTRLTVLSPEDEEAMLRDTGFDRVNLFFVGFSFRGWVAYAGASARSVS